MWNLVAVILLTIISFFGIIVNVVTKHAKKHPEAQEVREAFKDGSTFQIWQEKWDKYTFHYLVYLEDGRVGDWIVTNKMGTLVEKTALVPKDGTLKNVTKWLQTKARRIE